MEKEQIVSWILKENGVDKQIVFDGKVFKNDQEGWDYKIPNYSREYHERKLRDIFPLSPMAIKREEMWASVLNSLLESDPSLDVPKLIEIVGESEIIDYKNNGNLNNKFVSMIKDLYAIDAKSARKNKSYIFPFHLSIVANVKPSEPRDFDKLFLKLLCDDNGDYNNEIIDKLYGLFEKEEALTPIDALVVEVLKKEVGEENPDLIKLKKDDYINEGYGFFSLQRKLFQEDLKRIFDMKVSRAEKIHYFTVLMGFHFCIYTIKVCSFLIEEGEKFFEALKGKTVNWGDLDRFEDGFKGKIPFTFRDLKIPMASRSWTAYKKMSEKTIYNGYIFMVLLNTLRKMAGDEFATFEGIYKRMQQEKNFEEWVNSLLKAQRGVYIYDVMGFKGQFQEMFKNFTTSCEPENYLNCIKRFYASQKPGNRAPRTAGIQFINQFAEAGSSYSFIGRKPGIGGFYAIGDDLLILLTHLSIDFGMKKRFSDFLERISCYGFWPDEGVESVLMDKLDRAGLLQKYSDSGDAVYVRSIF